MIENPLNPFIPRWLDESGLSVLAFRILCRILRRGNFYESKTKLEKEFGVGNRALAAAFQELVSRGFVTETPMTGKPSCYQPSANQHHLPSANEHHPLVPDSTTPQCQPAPPPSANQHHNGISIKGKQLRQSSKETIVAPLPFDSDAFKLAWDEWQQHRREKKKPITPLSAKKALQELAAMGEARAIAAISHSIAKGWQGIYEETNGKTQQPTTTVKLGRRKFAGTDEDIDIPL